MGRIRQYSTLASGTPLSINDSRGRQATGSSAMHTMAERDSNNNARELEAPPVMPTDLVKMRPGVFISEVVDQYRGHLTKH
ncbi:unnamed protein product [Sphagnum jensenii]|uniref:Uncharacterized protein n=1 Tax=Sphagnum jensenii TaxID=128206 RepID=A0ABP1AEP1_9BRYO